jgi:predicted CopG family antitoxin
LGYSNLKAICVSPENYEKVKDFGRAGDSMNSVVSKLIEVYEKQGEIKEK